MSSHSIEDNGSEDERPTNFVVIQRKTHLSDGPAKPRRILDPKNDDVRKATVLKNITKQKASGSKFKVEFGPKEQPKGKIGDLLSSFCGVLARNFVPITTTDWRHADEKIKARVWNEVAEVFELPSSWRKHCLKRVGEASRNFRSDLHSTFIFGKPHDKALYTLPEAVEKYYPNVLPEDWAKFVMYKLSVDGQEASRKGRELRNLVESNNLRGRHGNIKKNIEHFDTMSEEAPRDESYKDPSHEELGNRTDDLSTQQTHGTYNSEGSRDVLEKTLGSQENSGRLKKKPKLYKQSSGPMNLSAKLDKLEQQLRDLEETIMQSQKAPMQSTAVNSEPIFVRPTNVVDFKKCYLLIDSVRGAPVLVATGRAWMQTSTNNTVHGRALGEDKVRVSVDVVIDRKARLPCPTDDGERVEDVVNDFVPWPRRLVRCGPQ